MNQCQVCASLRRADAESYVRQGMSVSQAARAIGVNNQALGRHMANHAAPVAEDAPSDAAIDGPAPTVFDAIGQQLASMLAGMNSTTQRLAILTEQRRLAESRARVVGPPASEPVRVQDVDGLPELIAAMHEALKPFPGAREAMAAIWREHRLELRP